jgi:hypothetical protein
MRQRSRSVTGPRGRRIWGSGRLPGTNSSVGLEDELVAPLQPCSTLERKKAAVYLRAVVYLAQGSVFASRRMSLSQVPRPIKSYMLRGHGLTQVSTFFLHMRCGRVDSPQTASSPPVGTPNTMTQCRCLQCSASAAAPRPEALEGTQCQLQGRGR